MCHGDKMLSLLIHTSILRHHPAMCSAAKNVMTLKGYVLQALFPIAD